jgi:hypothetical protein
MQLITFGSLQSYDYFSPHPEQIFTADEIPLLSKRHQARLKKAAKTPGNTIDTLACESCIFMNVFLEMLVSIKQNYLFLLFNYLF